ncbi:jg872 [Pararge aegeria aegeria]|uniref:Jg872 protein n=1 Tax=Pararge aegeria aegeria TaxID=348720 RepID=A0A8S4QR08_9NEOP|nr:jg872 [Pararge aegeria aegeria]
MPQWHSVILTISPASWCPQKAAGTSQNPSHQGCTPFSHDRVETIDTRFGKHPLRTARPGQSHQNPKRIIVLYAEGTALFMLVMYSML